MFGLIMHMMLLMVVNLTAKPIELININSFAIQFCGFFRHPVSFFINWMLPPLNNKDLPHTCPNWQYPMHLKASVHMDVAQLHRMRRNVAVFLCL
mmetsp:Transcript_5718/g.10522  ORF Transcript_5718/g.10522 Transcript_5718/m.10522 type:complete len:95 (-) Transcript_5718:178-462(-)